MKKLGLLAAFLLSAGLFPGWQPAQADTFADVNQETDLNKQLEDDLI